jgi:hypothetical protein
MSDVIEFIKIRQEIESLAAEIGVLNEGKMTAQSKTKLDKATELLTRLTEMADNDVQQIAVGRLTRLVTKLGTKVGTKAGASAPHKRVVKKDRGL